MTAATALDGADGVRAAVGRHLGYSGWLTVDQARIDRFAEATGDHPWIHVDVERATAGPFGAPIAHGYLTLALSNLFLPEIVEVRGFAMGVNYGVDHVRFPAPVRVGNRLRGGAELLEVVELGNDPPGALETRMLVTIDIDGEAKPACVVEALSRWYP
jgi:acyl dehydratase